MRFTTLTLLLLCLILTAFSALSLADAAPEEAADAEPTLVEFLGADAEAQFQELESDVPVKLQIETWDEHAADEPLTIEDHETIVLAIEALSEVVVADDEPIKAETPGLRTAFSFFDPEGEVVLRVELMEDHLVVAHATQGEQLFPVEGLERVNELFFGGTF